MAKLKFNLVDEYGFPDPSHDGYVYIASVGPMSKVGCTRNPESRIKNIEISAGLKFSSVYFSQRHNGCFKSEAKMHKTLNDFNVCKEWFLLDPSTIIGLCSEVKAMNNLYKLTVEMGVSK